MTDVYDLYDAAERYGVPFTGELVGPDYHEQVDYRHEMTLREVKEAGGRITRTRLLADPGWNGLVDISYVHATLPDGRIVPVTPPAINIGTRGTYKKALIEWARSEGVYAIGIGLLDAVSMLG